MFSNGKNGYLNTLQILCIQQNFGISKGGEYLYKLFDILPKQTTCEMEALQVQVYIEQYFTMNRELDYSVTRNDFGYVLICWKTLFLRVSY